MWRRARYRSSLRWSRSIIKLVGRAHPLIYHVRRAIFRKLVVQDIDRRDISAHWRKHHFFEFFSPRESSVMATKIINHLSNAINNFEQSIIRILSQGFPPRSIGALAYDCDEPVNIPQQINKSTKSFSLRDIIGDGFLWAVPKTRRPIEKRLSRKFGYPDGVYKMLVPKKNLVMCPNCGHNREVHLLCGHCYAKVRAETNEMQEVIKNTLGLEPVEKEVVVIYENEKENENAEFWKSQKIVEMPKKRPVWFHSNLTQSTTQQPSESKEVKPTELA